MFRLNLRNRIIIIYLLCILVPVLLVNGILYFYLSGDLFTYENENREASTERFAVKAINEMNYYRTLNSGDVGLGKGQEPYVLDVRTYTNNDQLIGLDHYLAIDSEVANEGWYQRLQQSRSGSLIVTKVDGTSTEKTLLFYNRVLNEQPHKVINAMEVTTGFLDDIAREEYTEGLYLLVNQYNDIVYASTDTFGNHDAYDSVLIFQKNEDYYYSEVIYNDMAYVNGWRIIGIFPKEAIYDRLIDRRNMIIMVVFAGLVIATILISSLSYSINRRFKKLNQQVEKIKSGDFSKVDIKTPGDELGHFIGEFHEMTDQMNVLVNEVYEKELEKKNLLIEKQQAELNALQSQVNPHFLYNVMNTIRMKSVVKGEKETATILKYVAAMFRRVINWEEDLILIEEEIDFVKDYLKVQKYRFEDRLTFTLEVDQAAHQGLIPKMTLQTFIENASTHGLENQLEGCHVRLKVTRDKDQVMIEVSDDGQGMGKEAIESLLHYIDSEENLGESVGLRNVYQRLKIYYGKEMTFRIQSGAGIGTTIALTLPYRERTSPI